MEFEQWKGFEKGEWKRQIDVRSFIQKNCKKHRFGRTER